jgi:hypothetical protein
LKVLVIFAPMKFFLLLFFAGMVLCSSCKRVSAVLTREEVIEVISRFDDGWRHKNLAKVDAVLAPAYVYFTQSGGKFIRDSVVQTAGSPLYILDTMERKEFIVELYENTAVVSTRWSGKGVYKGSPFNEDQRCSIVVMKRAGKVQILSEHCTPIKQASIFH